MIAWGTQTIRDDDVHLNWLHDFLELINLMSHDLIESKTLTHLVMRRTNDKSKRIKNITK